MSRRILLRSAAGVALASLLAANAAAHHGWSWADEDQVQLQGTVRKVQIAPPHPWIEVETANDGLWRVELGNPGQTQRSGFVEGAAKPGDAITALGNRSRDHAEKRMKAVRITVGGKTYDVYPERIGNR